MTPLFICKRHIVDSGVFVMDKFNWKSTVKDITDCNEFQRDSKIDLLKKEPSDKYTYDDFLYAYNFEKKNNKSFAVTGQIVTKMIMPYIYKSIDNDLKYRLDDIIMDCYVALVENAIPKLDMNKIANAKYPANMLCGYCKLYCKEVICNNIREGVSVISYKNGYRREMPFSNIKTSQSVNIERNEEKDTAAFLDNRHFYASNVELRTVEDDLRRKQLIAGLYAAKYKISFKRGLRKKIDINSLLKDYDNLSCENRKTVIEYAIEVTKEKKGLKIADADHTANIRFSDGIYGDKKIVGLSHNEDVYVFLNKFILNLNEKQLDDFLEYQQVYEKIQDMFDKFNIQKIKNSPYDLDLKPMDSTWDRLIKNHIDIDYLKCKEESEEEFEK